MSLVDGTMDQNLKSLTVGVGEPDACIIWLHGLGAGADDFIPAVPYLKLPEQLNVKFLFPQAPTIPVTINSGWEMPAWYDILKMLPEREIVPEHLQQSARALHALTAEQIALGIPADRIIWIGFSQGGAVVLEASLNAQDYNIQNLPGAVMALSTYQALPSHSADECDTHFWHAHGAQDDVVPFAMGKKAYEQSFQQSINSTWQSYPMGHEVCLAQLVAMGKYIVSRLAV